MKMFLFVLIAGRLLFVPEYGYAQNTEEEGRAVGYKSSNSGQIKAENTKITPASGDDPATIIATASSCNPVEYGGSAPFLTAVAYLNGFYVIQKKAEWLPPFPGSSGNDTITGIDVDGDCIRDDIEHYIARKFNQPSQQKLRKYLFEYAVWMNRFLALNISVDDAKTSSNSMAAAGECVDQILGNHTETKTVLDDLFAQFHNTFPRSNRYIDNLSQLGGWTTRETITVSCP
jgi:hypothetical protein